MAADLDRSLAASAHASCTVAGGAARRPSRAPPRGRRGGARRAPGSARPRAARPRRRGCTTLGAQPLCLCAGHARERGRRARPQHRAGASASSAATDARGGASAVTVSESQGPARGYKWRDAWPGNDLALRHGATPSGRSSRSPTNWPRPLCAVRPDLDVAEYRHTVAAWSRAEARVVLLTAWCDEHGLVDEDGKATGAANLLEKVERAAARCRERLGMDPRSDAELVILRGQARHARSDLDALVEAGARVRAEVEGPAPSWRRRRREGARRAPRPGRRRGRHELGPAGGGLAERADAEAVIDPAARGTASSRGPEGAARPRTWRACRSRCCRPTRQRGVGATRSRRTRTRGRSSSTPSAATSAARPASPGW